MKNIHLVGLLLLVFTFSACSISNTYMSGKMLMSIQQGMTTNEVSSIFGGGPDFRRFDGGVEEWEYRRYSSTVGNWSIVLVSFIDGRVSGLDSFEDKRMDLNAASVSSPSPTAITTIGVFPNPPAVREPQRTGLMLEQEFRDFLNKVKLTVTTADQKNLIVNAMQQHEFTSSQACELIKEIFMSEDKMEMMLKMYPYVVDKRNFNKVIDLLSYSGDRDKVRKAIGASRHEKK